MPNQVVVLFVFTVVTGFGIVWASNELRLRFQYPHLECCFYFNLAAVTYGLVNWIAPFFIMLLTNKAEVTDPNWSVAVFVLIGVPLLLTKMYFMVLMFQVLLGRKRPFWLNKFSVGISVFILLLSIVSIKSYYDDANFKLLWRFIFGLGVSAVLIEFFMIIRYLFEIRRIGPGVLGRAASSFGLLFLLGYTMYVFATYSTFLQLLQPVFVLTPYIYFIIHFLPLIVLWLYHQKQPLPILSIDKPNLKTLIKRTGLTAREADILNQIIRGASNKEIAAHSFISPHTVRNHIYNIYKKTGITNRFQLLALCQTEEKSSKESMP